MKRVRRDEEEPQISTGNAPRPGLVIAHLGKGLAVEPEQGDIVLCHTRRRLGDVAVGDRVLWVECEGGLGRVEEVLPRRSALMRPGYAGKLRCVAANLDCVYVVTAAEPEPDLLLVDQYLAVCEHRAIDAVLVVNKCDLPGGEAALHSLRQLYEPAGYRVLAVSARVGMGMAELKTCLSGKTSIFSGQSGVGKSSLTNTLLPEKNLATSTLSEKSGLGRHTTTTATLYRLPEGGHLIDSPGVAVFGLAEMSGADLAAGYREFRPLIAECQFNDCRHLNDKGCAVRRALENGAVGLDRYQRYVKLLEKLANQT
jgi:ribosome biogenesis GTPase